MKHLLRFTFLVTGFGTLGIAMHLGYRGQAPEMGVCAFLALALLFFAQIEKFSEFKASTSGFEAKTKLLLDEAQATIAQLRELAMLMAKNQVALLVRHSRLGALTDDDYDKAYGSIRELLLRLGVEDARVEEAFHDVYKFTVFDYAFCILGRHTAPIGLGEQAVARWRVLREDRLENPVSPEELRAFLRDYQLLTPAKEELLLDYEFYLKTKKHRRPEVWRTRDEWNTL